MSVLPPPVPPPPPIAVTASMREFIKAQVRPRTEAVCLAGLVDSDLSKLCVEFANALSRPSSSGLVGSFMPHCTEICWHSCSAASRTDVDSFVTCRGLECADTLCRDFMIRCVACSYPTTISTTHRQVTRLHKLTTCATFLFTCAQ